jgi:DNA-binding NarL/FixJ family response regulator
MIKVMIVDDQQLILDLLEQMLKNSGEVEVVARAANGNEAIKYAAIYNPDVILMDIIMPECDGIEAIKEIKNANANIKILALTGTNTDDSVKGAIRNGADGYILKNSSKDELLIAIKGVFHNMRIIDKNVRDVIESEGTRKFAEYKTGKTINLNGVKVSLSEREINIIKMIVDGKSTNEIARELFISEGRLRNIITEILSRLMLGDRTQLAVFAIKNNLVM